MFGCSSQGAALNPCRLRMCSLQADDLQAKIRSSLLSFADLKVGDRQSCTFVHKELECMAFGASCTCCACVCKRSRANIYALIAAAHPERIRQFSRDDTAKRSGAHHVCPVLLIKVAHPPRLFQLSLCLPRQRGLNQHVLCLCRVHLSLLQIREDVDKLDLQLQNLLYEKTHILKEIRRCHQFRYAHR